MSTFPETAESFRVIVNVQFVVDEIAEFAIPVVAETLSGHIARIGLRGGDGSGRIREE